MIVAFNRISPAYLCRNSTRKIMKLSLPTFLIAASAGCQAYLPLLSPHTSPLSLLPSKTSLFSSQSSDAAFSAFADSLEEDPDVSSFSSRVDSPSIEKTWQAKLEDLLDPKTNLAERQILLSELLNSNEQIRESVLDALSNRKVRKSGFVHKMENCSMYEVRISFPFFAMRQLLLCSLRQVYSNLLSFAFTKD